MALHADSHSLLRLELTPHDLAVIRRYVPPDKLAEYITSQLAMDLPPEAEDSHHFIEAYIDGTWVACEAGVPVPYGTTNARVYNRAIRWAADYLRYNHPEDLHHLLCGVLLQNMRQSHDFPSP